MPHTHSLTELAFFYIGAVLYGHLPVAEYSLGSVALLLLGGLAFGPTRPALSLYRWHFLAGAVVLGLITASDMFPKYHFILMILRGISVPTMILVLVATVRLTQAEKIREATRKRARAISRGPRWSGSARKRRRPRFSPGPPGR